MKFKGVLVDIDNTIYDYKASHLIALEKVAQYCESKFKISREEINVAYMESRKSINTELCGTASSHNRLLYFQRMVESMSMNSMSHGLDLYNIYWDAFLEKMEFLDGAIDVLNVLKKCDVCFVTDLTAHIQFRKIQKLKLFNYAEFIVTSEEAGAEKPDPRIFELAMKKINKNPTEVCMIGDNYEKDVMGAVALGIHTFWLNRDNKKIAPHALITEFKEFNDLRGVFDD